MAELSYRMLNIAGVPAGLLGLTELFAELFEAEIAPESPEISEKLIKGVRKHNFVPKPAVLDYQAVLINEYRKYFQNRSSGQSTVAREYGIWEGHPREHIPWFPVVSIDLCNGCGNCIEVCPKDVFEMNDQDRAVVVEPFLCIVGCCFCKSACDPQAILMPEKSMLDQFRHGQRHVT